ncbi:hypothetical protein JCM19037_712 [Geomicrobium sp. JCM 19037]|uniref:DUF3891 family protein n=1 Tax=Geomicrobium sp. JCM 19037 TaxID=1460634 RepID=UPI00045F2287|nr:DUF3891 family protein [Geomicrobium sp. JCM 19037]GAK02477.1 hypothetical protein JCM19037_712 [Geomicrobium sp. JCM 19037]
MIIREESEFWVVTTQHEHGGLSGHLASRWGDTNRRKQSDWQSVVIAAREHDRGWKEADHLPKWDAIHGQPHDFNSYPDEDKIALYRNGIEEVQLMDERAAYLVSRHLSAFFISIDTPRASAFIKGEQLRQSNMRIKTDTTIDQQILTMCDELSLYACLNRPGVQKKDEFPWFKNGFSSRFTFLDDQIVQAHWHDERRIVLDPFPLLETIRYPLHSFHLQKEIVFSDGLKAAWNHAKMEKNIVTFMKASEA